MATPVNEIEVDDRVVRVTNPDRVYFPRAGLETKLDLVEYYLAVGDGIVNALFERPCMLHRFPKGLAGDKVHQKRVPAGAPPWLETVSCTSRASTAPPTSCVSPSSRRDLGGADVDRRVPSVEQPSRRHREAGRVAHRPRPRAGVRLRDRAAGRPRRPRGARRARRRRMAQDLGRLGDAHLRPHPAGPRLPGGAARGPGVRPRGGATPPATSPRRGGARTATRPTCSSTTTRTPATTRSPPPTRCAASRTAGFRRRSAGTRSTTSTPTTSPSRPCRRGSPSWVTCTPASTTPSSTSPRCWSGPTATSAAGPETPTVPPEPDSD